MLRKAGSSCWAGPEGLEGKAAAPDRRPLLFRPPRPVRAPPRAPRLSDGRRIICCPPRGARTCAWCPCRRGAAQRRRTRRPSGGASPRPFLWWLPLKSGEVFGLLVGEGRGVVWGHSLTAASPLRAPAASAAARSLLGCVLAARGALRLEVVVASRPGEGRRSPPPSPCPCSPTPNPACHHRATTVCTPIAFGCTDSERWPAWGLTGAGADPNDEMRQR